MKEDQIARPGVLGGLGVMGGRHQRNDGAGSRRFCSRCHTRVSGLLVVAADLASYAIRLRPNGGDDTSSMLEMEDWSIGPKEASWRWRLVDPSRWVLRLW